MKEVVSLAPHPLGLDALLIFHFQQPHLELVPQAREPALPAVAPSDDRCIDEELFPAPWRAKSPGDDRLFLGRFDPRRGLGEEIELDRLGRRFGSERVSRRNPDDLIFVRGGGHDRRAQRIELRDLRQRKVLRKAYRGELFRGAVEEREKRAPSRVGSFRSVLEIRGDLGSGERVFEERRVDFGRTEKYRNPVEREPLLRLSLDCAGELRGLLGFTRGRDHRHVLGPAAARGGGLTEYVALQIDECRTVLAFLRGLRSLRLTAEGARETDQRRFVRGRDRRQHRRRARPPSDGFDERLLERALDGNVEEQHRALDVGGSLLRERERESAIGHALLPRQVLVPGQKERECFPEVAEPREPREPRKVVRADSMEAALVKRRGESADESRSGSDTRERAKSLFPRRRIEEPRDDRFLREAARGRHAFTSEGRESEAIGEGVEGGAPKSEERASFGSELPEEVIGGFERGRDQENGTFVLDLREPPPRFFPSRRRAGGDHDAMQRHAGS